jgi:hypothetical protein
VARLREDTYEAAEGAGEARRQPRGPRGADAPRSPVGDELAWLAEQAPDNIFVRDQIVPKVMRRLVATGKPEDLKLCVEFVAKVTDAHTREKALDGLALALDKQTVNAPEAWAALRDEIAKGNNPKLVALSNRLAVSFRDPAALKRAVATAANTGLNADARAEAVRQLGALRRPRRLCCCSTSPAKTRPTRCGRKRFVRSPHSTGPRSRLACSPAGTTCRRPSDPRW